MLSVFKGKFWFPGVWRDDPRERRAPMNSGSRGCPCEEMLAIFCKRGNKTHLHAGKEVIL